MRLPWSDWFQKRRFEREMAEELRHHLEQQTAANVRAGLPLREAVDAARRQFGGLTQIQEACRDQRRGLWLETLARDVRYAVRSLCRSPGFTTVAVLTLALGLAVNTTIFAVISYLFFTPLPVRDADRLVVLTQQRPGVEFSLPISWPDYLALRAGVPEFRDALGIIFRPVHLAVPGRPADRTWIEAVSGNYFEMLGAQPGRGRLFLPGEGERAGADPIVVLAHDYWQNQLGGDPTIIGRALHLNGRAFTVVGITAPAFRSAQWALAPSAFVPATMIAQVLPGHDAALETAGWPLVKVMAHLAPGASLAQAKATVDTVYARLAADRPPAERAGESTMILRPERWSRPDASIAGVMPLAAAVFFGLVLLVLVIACANVANLMLARLASRQRELGIRAGLGATRGRLLRQLLTEGVVLALAAGVLGFFLSIWAGVLLERFTPRGDLPLNPEQNFDWNLPGYTLALAVLAGLLTTVLPAWRASRLDLPAWLKGTPGVTGGSRHRLRNILVVSQLAFCVIVLVSGGLFLRSLTRLATLDLGFRPERLLLAAIDPATNGYTPAQMERFVETLLTRTRALPGVEAATFATIVPLDTVSDFRDVLRVQDAALPADDPAARRVQAGYNQIDLDYLGTVGARLVQGRTFGREDTATSEPVAIINETLARRLWPAGDALGSHLTLNDGVNRRIVGLVHDGKYVMLGEQPRPFVFAPWVQTRGGPLALHLRTRGDPAAAIPALRALLLELDANLPVFAVRTMEEHLRTGVFGFMPLRMAATLAGVQGALGLALAVLGLYGVVAYTVAQRTREIGLRMALGAAPRDVLRLILRGGMRFTLIGLGLGVLVALGLSHVLAGLLYGLDPLDVPVFGSVILLLLGITWLACWLPARRALRVDPLIALRSE